MNFPHPLVQARLIKRYKRFLADVELPDGRVETVYCPNTGSMRNCARPGSPVWLSGSDNPKRKYRYTWQLVENAPEELACIHSALANKVVAEAIEAGKIGALAGYHSVRPEVSYGEEGSRIDFLLSNAEEQCYVEVKCVTLHEAGGTGMFPDAVSARGTRHLRELMAVRESGARAMLLFCVQNSAIERVEPAREIDPKYAATLIQAQEAGVEIMAYATDISTRGLRLADPIPFSSGDKRPGQLRLTGAGRRHSLR